MASASRSASRWSGSFAPPVPDDGEPRPSPHAGTQPLRRAQHRGREHRRSPPRDGIRTRGRNEAMNVLLVTTDQQRADTIGAYGSRLEATPNLDRLAATGVRFDACRTQNPYCQPSRATILTGQYPSTHGVTSNGIDVPKDAEAKSVATAFKNAGYSTAIIGKAHFSSTYPLFPTGKLESV